MTADQLVDVLIWFSADGAMIAAGLLALYVFAFVVPRDKWWYWGWRIFVAGVTTYLAAKLLGYFYQPNELRPYQLMGVEPRASYLPNPGFPSDHVLFSTFLTLAVWFSTKRREFAAAMLILTLIVGIGRVWALVHAPIDVLGGLLIPLIGIIWYRHTSRKSVK